MNSPITNAGPASNRQVVVFPPDRSIGVLALSPLYITNHKPQARGAMGVNIAMANSDADGLLAWILSYTEMAIGDVIEVFLEPGLLAVATIQVTDANFDAQGNANNIPFYIALDHLEHSFAPHQQNSVDGWFVVKRISGNSEKSPVAPVYYKYPGPAEPDTDPSTPKNQGMAKPVVADAEVDQTVIDNGTFVIVRQYFNQFIGDMVTLAYGSLLVKIPVTTLGDIVIELTPAMLATLKPTNSLLVSWSVFDVVENFSGWSDAVIVTVKPGMHLLNAPIFEQADTDNAVNYESLADGDLLILLIAVFAKGDVINLLLQGVTKGGDTVNHTFSRTLTTASRSQDFPVDNSWARSLIGGDLHASFTVHKAGKIQNSKSSEVTITGTSLPLGLPTVEPLVDGKLPIAPPWPLCGSPITGP